MQDKVVKLLLTTFDEQDYEYISEAAGDGTKKKWKVRGPLIQSEKTNRNGRVYPKHLVEREVKNYNKDFIEPKWAHGCLGHPPTPATDESKISHYVSELKMDGNYGIGEMILMDTTCGIVAQKVFESGQRLCVSTRGTGSLSRDGKVNDDWSLIAIDLVHVPSGQDCVVNAVLEAKEWIIKNNSQNEKIYEALETSLSKNGSKNLKWDLLDFFRNIN